MTERTLTELRGAILACLDTPRTVRETADAVSEDRGLVLDIMTRMAAEKLIMIAPGTSGVKWQSAARVKAIRQTEGEE